MASFKLYHDTRSVRKDGTSPIKIAVNHKSRFLINLAVYVKPENFIDGEIIVPESKARQKSLNDYIHNRLIYVENTLNKLRLLDRLQGMTDKQLKNLLDTGKDMQEDEPRLFREHYLKFVNRKTKAGTKEIYRHTLNKIDKFCNLETLTFDDITTKWLYDFDAELSKTCSINTRSIHLRNIRAIINDAITEEIIDQNHYPFRRFKIKHEATRKRSLSLEQLRTLRDYDCMDHQKQYRDIFMLIFYLCGINMVDLCSLTEITDGRIEYRRAKTGRLYSIKVEPEALNIINRYKGKKYLLDINERYGNYKNYLHRMNINLQQIGPIEYIPNNTQPKGNRTKTGPDKRQYNGILPELTTYWARHTWATIAASLDIPKETIAAALGHGGNSITDIYIDFDQKKVDQANRKILDAIL